MDKYSKVLIGVNKSKNNPKANQARVWLKGTPAQIVAALGKNLEVLTKRPLVEKLAKQVKAKQPKQKTAVPA